MVDEADEAGVDVVVNAELVEWLQAYSVLGDNLKSGAEGATVPAAIWAQLQNGKVRVPVAHPGDRRGVG